MKGSILKSGLFSLVLAFILSGDSVLAQPSEKQGTEPQTELEAITVTAEKREGEIQNIPVSLSVVSETQIDDFGLDAIKDVMRMSPNLYITDTGMSDQSFATMRGIGASMTGTPTVGVYIDDVYTLGGLDTVLEDIERIEVLRGPQGTLYGRNSEAGVINIVTKMPGAVWTGRLGADIGNFDSCTATGMISGPLGEKLFLRGALRYSQSDGWFKNRFTGSDKAGETKKYNGRISLLADPTEQLELLFSYDLSRADDPAYAHFAPFGQGRDLRKNINVDYEGKTRKDTDTVSLRGRYDLDGTRLVSITSWRREDGMATNDVDFTPADLMRLTLRRKGSTFSQEIRLHSTDESRPMQWLVGVIGLHEKIKGSFAMYMNFMNMGMGVPAETSSASYDLASLSGALFGEGTYTVADRLYLTLGLRYDITKQTFDYDRPALGPVLTQMGYLPVSDSVDDTHNAWLPKVAISYDLNSNIMPYLSVSRGFRSGGYNSVENLGSSFAPEFTWNYEAGMKTNWLNNRLQLNAALFYIDWTDMQVEVLTSGGSAVYTNNAAEAHSQGFELEMTARPVTGLDLFAGLACTKAKYDSYSVGPAVYNGNKIADVPEYTCNLGGSYRFGSGFFISALYAHFGDIPLDVANTRTQDNYGLLSAKIGYESDRFDFYLYGRNLLDKEYATRQVKMFDTWYGRAGEPLTVGVNLAVRF